MTEQDSEEIQLPEKEIEFRDRKIFVRLPRPEQLLVWKRTLSQLQKMGDADWNGVQVMTAMERLRKILDSVLANSTDVDWLDDEMLAGHLTLQDTAQILTLTVEAYTEDENRATRRAAKKAAPAKKATRKAPR